MLIFSSPAKTFSPKITTVKPLDEPEFLKISQQIVDFLKTKTQPELQQILQVSPKLAAVNFDRFTHWSEAEKIPALFAYRGDVFAKLPVDAYTAKQREYAHKSVRILTGLYGVLKGMDAIKPYRLEMKLQVENYGKLSNFWQEQVTDFIRMEAKKDGHRAILNCASYEYSAAIDFTKIEVPVITAEFRIERNGQLKNFGLLAKKARGNMIDFCIQNQITDVQEIQHFCADGYTFNKQLSTDSEYFFTKKA